MKQVKLSSIADQGVFMLSAKSCVDYTVQTKSKGKVTFTSNTSGRTYCKSGKTIVYV